MNIISPERAWHRAEVVALLLAAAVFVLCVLALPGCVLKVQLLPPPVAVDAATDAWQQATHNRVSDLMSCADVTVQACVNAREAARKEK